MYLLERSHISHAFNIFRFVSSARFKFNIVSCSYKNVSASRSVAAAAVAAALTYANNFCANQALRKGKKPIPTIPTNPN